MSAIQNGILRKLLLGGGGKSRLWAALVALCVGASLLLVSVAIWSDFNELLYGKDRNDAIGSTYMVVGKRVTEQNMGTAGATVFTDAEIADVRKAPQVQDVGLITANNFPVYAVMGGHLAFETDMAVESVPDHFLDQMPEDWKWDSNSHDLPLILSSQFLDIYNYVFAPSQHLPQLSERSVKSLAIQLKAGPAGNSETYLAHVVGFSDRIGSVLVPQSFIDYGNRKYAQRLTGMGPSQLILKTKDPSDVQFGKYLQQHDYNTNSQNLRWSKIRSIVEVVTTATGVLAVLLLGIGALVFILFIELTIARAHASLVLLREIGYSARYLSRFMNRRFVPLVAGTLLVASLITMTGQLFAANALKTQGLVLASLPGMAVWGALVVCLVMLLVLVTMAIRKAISNG